MEVSGHGGCCHSFSFSLFQEEVETGQWSRVSSDKVLFGIPCGKCFERSWALEKAGTASGFLQQNKNKWSRIRTRRDVAGELRVDL